jgi:hypothetical protein
MLPGPLDPRLSLDMRHLEMFAPDSRGRYVLTCPEVHLTYVGRRQTSLDSLLAELDERVGEKGYTISDYTAVQETLGCGLTGYPEGSVHIAIRLVGTSGVKFRIYNRETFAITDIPHIRLIKKPQQWDWIVNVLHPQLGQPLRRTSVVAALSGVGVQIHSVQNLGQVLGPADLPPKARGDVERYTKAKRAFDSFCKTNTAFVRDILLVATNEGRGKGHWYSYFDDVSEITDYLMMHGQAVVFHNCWSPGHIISELQKVCNSGVRPASVILCYLTARPPDDVVVKIHQLCDQISSGTVLSPGYRQTDVPLSTWKPHVFVFANFYPEVVSGFDNGHWGLSLPSQMNYTSHLIVPRDYVDTLVEAAKRHLRPSLEVVDIKKFLESLREVLCDFEVRKEDLPGRFKSVQAAAAALFEFFKPEVRADFLRRGFLPVFTLMKTFSLDSARPPPEVEIVGETVQITHMTMPTSIIGKTGRIGNVLVRSVPLTDEDRELFAEKIQSLVGMAPLPSPNMIEDMARNKGLPVPPPVPLICEGPPAPPSAKEVLFDELSGPFPEMGPIVESNVYRTLNDFLRGYGGMLWVKTPSPMGEVVSKGWMVESCRVVVKVDFGLPPKGEAFQMLYWFEQGYRIIRMRADDVGVDWAGGVGSTVELEHALRSRSLGSFVYLDRVSGRDSWRDLRLIVSRLSARLMCHNAWWEEFIGPLPVDAEITLLTEDSIAPEETQEIMPNRGLDGVASETLGILGAGALYEPVNHEDGRPRVGSSQGALDDIPQELTPLTTPSVARATSSGNGDLSATGAQARLVVSYPEVPAADTVQTRPTEPVERPQFIAWAIYCRTTSGSDDLLAQRTHCLTHAKAKGLVPVAGPKNYFEDICPAEAPPGSRPGLQAFLKSGATGMLCAHTSLLADNDSQVAALAFLKARGVAFGTVDG